MKRLAKVIWNEKCPKCGIGGVFIKRGGAFIFKMPKMNKECSHCHHKFEKEPGYFFGAMYVSYALGVAEMVAVFVISWFLGIPVKLIFFPIAATLLLLTTFNFRKARLIWMSII